jgi:hypothetical protein
MILFCLGKKRLEAAVNLSQFPENRKKQNCDHEQQELDSHFLAFREQGIGNVHAFYSPWVWFGTNVWTHEFLPLRKRNEMLAWQLAAYTQHKVS